MKLSLANTLEHIANIKRKVVYLRLKLEYDASNENCMSLKNHIDVRLYELIFDMDLTRQNDFFSSL